jgi:hypothetical protein
LAKNTNHAQILFRQSWVAAGNYRKFAIFAVWHGSCNHHDIPGSRPEPCSKQRGIEMNRNHAFGNRLAAALSAFALSLVMISGTVSVPAKAAASGQAYVGEIA